MRIVQAGTAGDLAQIQDLFVEYARELGVDLGFQGFTLELAGLPGLYAPPAGRLLLAIENGEPAGCVALRPREAGVCEMKRLFVRPAFRHRAIGRALAERIISEARLAGYCLMQLDTLPALENATRLYESLGFSRCPGYYDTPLPETIFMELRL